MFFKYQSFVVLFIVSIFGFLFLASDSVNAATCYWSASSSQSMANPNNWDDGLGSACTITAADTIVFNGNTTTNATWDMATATAAVLVNSGYTGTITIAGNATTTNFTLNSGTTTLSGSANFMVLGNLLVSSTLNMSAGNLTVSGTFSNTTTVNLAGGIVTLNGAGQVIGGAGALTFYDLIIRGSASLAKAINGHSLSAIGAIDFSSYDVVLSSMLTTGSDGSIHQTSGNITTVGMQNNGSFNKEAGNLNLSGALMGAGTLVQSAGTTTFSGGNAISDNPNSKITLNILVVSAGQYTLGSNVTSSAAIISGTLNGASYTLNLIGSGTPLTISGTFNANTSTVSYSNAGSQTIATGTYYNLTVSSTATLGGAVTTTNNLTVTGGTLALGANNLVVGGSFTGSGVVDQTIPSSGSVTMTGVGNIGSSSSVAPLYLNQLIITGTTTLVDTISASSVQIDPNSVLNGGGQILILIGSSTSFNINGTFNADTSTVWYNGSDLQTVATGTYYNLTVSSAATLGGNVTSTNAFINNGTFNLGNYNLVAVGSYTNNATTTQAGTGKAKKAPTNGMTATTYDTGANTVTIIVTDPTANLLGSTAETRSATIVADNYVDSETVTLMETTVTSGIFSGSIAFNPAVAAAFSNSKIDTSGNGHLTLTYVGNSANLTGAGTAATYTGSVYTAPSTGGSGGPISTVPSATVGSVSITTDGYTTTRHITLQFKATNAAQMAIAEDPNFVGATWQAYAAVQPFILSAGNGVKIIYVKFRSADGGVTSAFNLKTTLNESGAATVAATASVVAVGRVGNPDSAVVITQLPALSLQPGAVLKFNYQYQNISVKPLSIKIIRQWVNSLGKVVKTVTAKKTLRAGATFKGVVNERVAKTNKSGDYTVKVKVYNAKTGKIIDENEFSITIEKLKKKR